MTGARLQYAEGVGGFWQRPACPAGPWVLSGGQCRQI